MVALADRHIAFPDFRRIWIEITVFPRHKIDSPQGQGGRPVAAQVGEGVQHGHVGPADGGVGDLGKEGHDGDEHGVQRDLMQAVDDEDHGVIVVGEAAVLVLEVRRDVDDVGKHEAEDQPRRHGL